MRKVNLINAIICKKSCLKGDIRRKTENLQFYDPGLTDNGVVGKSELLYRLFIHENHSEAVKAITKEIQGKIEYFMTHRWGQGVNLAI